MCLKKEKTETKNKAVLDSKADYIRAKIKKIAQEVNEFKEELLKSGVAGEAVANNVISYRCLEDASMRLGKVKQHLNGGVSAYDQNVVGSQDGKVVFMKKGSFNKIQKECAEVESK